MVAAAGRHTHERCDVHLQVALLEDALLVGHADEEQAQRFDVEGTVLHVDEEKIETRPSERACVIEGAVVAEDAEGRLPLRQQLDCAVEPRCLRRAAGAKDGHNTREHDETMHQAL